MNFPEVKAYTISELNREIKGLLDIELGSIWVEGEISNLRTPFSGHSYFTLKDENSQLRAVLFKGRKSLVRFEMADGQQVLAKGRITVYEPRGEYQVIVEYMEPKGLGALQKAFEQLKERLFKEGLFDEKHKKPIPFLPTKIGLVTSSTGAAIRDILQILDRRFPNIGVIIAPVKVQGEGAAREIAAAVQDLNAHGEVDVLVVGRGGGSLEDLWAFNEEVVARAVFESRIPVISAVGHEIDFTISDFAADLRAPTPSAAAELVVPEKTELMGNLSSLRNSLIQAMKHKVEIQEAKLDKLRHRRILREPGEIYNAIRQRVDNLTFELERAMQDIVKNRNFSLLNLSRSLELLSPLKKLKDFGERVDNLSKLLEEKIGYIIQSGRGELEKESRRLDALSPLATLSRGFSVCKTRDGQVLKNSGQVSAGDRINLRLSKGELLCQVEKKLK